jgi:hypothetical protein
MSATFSSSGLPVVLILNTLDHQLRARKIGDPAHGVISEEYGIFILTLFVSDGRTGALLWQSLTFCSLFSFRQDWGNIHEDLQFLDFVAF